VLVTAGYSLQQAGGKQVPSGARARGAGVAQGNIAHPPDYERVIKEIVEQQPPRHRHPTTPASP